MSRTIAILVLSFLGFSLAGCAASDEHQSLGSTTRPHEVCLVCKMNYDLACIDVSVNSLTPTVAYQGRTYYFCSKECQDKFAKSPAKYVPK